MKRRILVAVLLSIGFILLTFVLVPSIWPKISTSHSDFMPHGFCLRWDPPLLMTMIVANAGIAVAYFAIPTALLYFVRSRKDLPYPWMFQLFGLFIISCGVTHLMKIWTLYQPWYWAEASIDAYTAIISLITAGALWPLIPKALALKSAEGLEKTNRILQEQADMLALTHDTIMVRDLDGTIRYWNKGAEEMYGYSKEEAIGQKSHDLLKTIFPKPLSEIDKDIFNKKRWEGELTHFTRQGLKIVVASRHALKIDAKGVPTAVLEINNDITERKQAEKNQLDLAQELKRSNDELAEFATVASHDLQEPLRGIAGSIQLLEELYRGKGDEKADKLITHAVGGASRMHVLIDDLLTLSRITTKGRILEPTDLSQTIEKALENLSTAIDESQAIITWDSLPFIPADRIQLVQLFQNLIGNAIKFRSTDIPKIHITCIGHDKDWLFSIQDNGIGFDNNYAEKIFLPFKRLHTRNKFPGTGIGLAICKRIVERHKGRIWADSEPNKGAIFYLSFPC